MTAGEDRGDAIRARAGDPAAFGRLVERYALRVHDLARRMLRDATEAEDVVQQAFLNAWRALDRYDPDRPFRNWLLRIASNLCRNRIAARGRSHLLPPRGGDEGVPETTADEEDAGNVGAGIDLRAAVEALSPRYRLPVILHHLHGLSLADVAEILEVPVATVKTHLHRGRQALRVLLGLGETGEAGRGTTRQSNP